MQNIEETGKWVFFKDSVRSCSVTFPGTNAPLLYHKSHYPVMSPSIVLQSVQALLLHVREDTRIQLKKNHSHIRDKELSLKRE